MLTQLATAISSTSVSAEHASAAQFDRAVGMPGWQVPGDHGEGLGQAPVGQRDARQRRGGGGAGQAGDDVASDAGFGAGERFLSSPAEDERVPAFEADHVLPGPCVGNERRADFFLAELVFAGCLARVDQQHARAERCGERRVGEAVADDDVGVALRGWPWPGVCPRWLLGWLSCSAVQRWGL